MRLAPGALFSDRRLRRPRSVKLADGPAPARSLRRPLLDERAECPPTGSACALLVGGSQEDNESRHLLYLGAFATVAAGLAEC
jgi:hypothetical protein